MRRRHSTLLNIIVDVKVVLGVDCFAVGTVCHQTNNALTVPVCLCLVPDF